VALTEGVEEARAVWLGVAPLEEDAIKVGLAEGTAEEQAARTSERTKSVNARALGIVEPSLGQNTAIFRLSQ
jgi:hypothetical protein